MTWQKWLSQYLFSFPFSFLLFSYQWTHEIKVTHKEAWDIRTGLGLQMYISSIEIQWELY